MAFNCFCFAKNRACGLFLTLLDDFQEGGGRPSGCQHRQTQRLMRGLLCHSQGRERKRRAVSGGLLHGGRTRLEKGSLCHPQRRGLC